MIRYPSVRNEPRAGARHLRTERPATLGVTHGAFPLTQVIMAHDPEVFEQDEVA